MSAFWKGKRVFITGATGLVGSWLTKELIKRGAYVVVLIRDWDPQSELIRSEIVRKVSVINGSLEEFGCLERAVNEYEVDSVFHLGAQTIVGTAYRYPLSTFEANVRGSYLLLEACRLHSQLIQRVIIASSDKAYGEGEILPYTEEMPLNGKHPYDVSKSCADLLAKSYSHTYQLPVAIARCGNIYGGGDLNWSRIVPGTIRAFKEEKSPLLRSDGTYTRDYVYVQDVVEAYLLLAEKLTENKELHGEAFNFAPERPSTVLEIVTILQSLMCKEYLKPTILNNTCAEIRNQYLCCSKAKEILGWRPHFSLEEGLKETVVWYERFFSTRLPQKNMANVPYLSALSKK